MLDLVLEFRRLTLDLTLARLDHFNYLIIYFLIFGNLEKNAEKQI